MPKRSKYASTDDAPDSELNLLAWLATCASVIAFLFYFRNGQVMLYGDAIAHINIARRVFDSRTPGLLQLGTVWLPLPHLVMIPFIVSQRMWQQGVGGSIPSMAGYVFGVIGIFRFTRGVLSRSAEPDGPARVAAWIAALIYAANPNLLYMQSTAMGESLYLAFFIWSVVYFSEWQRADAKALTKSGLCLIAACLTRYDGWFLAATMAAIVVLQAFFPGSADKDKSRIRVGAMKFVLLAAFAPVLWFVYNAIIYRNPLEFENGPYSAKAIEQRTQNGGTPGHPGSRNPILAGMYFVKSAEANMAQPEWLQRTWILLSMMSLAVAIFTFLRRDHNASAIAHRMWLPFTLLLIPLPFYALSVAYGGVPIFIPYWWPFTHYNVRYGLQLLPAFAAASAVLVNFILRIDRFQYRVRLAAMLAVLAIAIAGYATVWQATPICLEEARVNMRTRNQLQTQLSIWIAKLPTDCTLLMYLGDQVGAVERAGFPLKQTINEGNHRVWKQPVDTQGLWEQALADPRKYADYVIAFEGDPVWQAVHDLHLHELVEIHVTGQARGILYKTR
jgi:hypothetical protein